MRRLLGLLLFIFPALLSAQTPLNLDSLMRLLPRTKEDTSKVNLLIQIGQQHEGSNLDSSAYYYLLANQLSEKLDFTLGRIKYIQNITFGLNLRGELDSSLNLNLKALEMAKTYGDQKILAACLGNVGATYQYLKKLDQAVFYYLQALKISEEIGLSNTILLLNQNLGIAYADLGQNETALTYHNKSVELSRASGNPVFISQNLLNRSVTLVRLKRFEDGIRDLEESGKIASEIGDDMTLANGQLNLGNLMITTSRFEQAKPHFEKALEISRRMDIQDIEILGLRGMANFYFFTQQTDSAEFYIQESLQLAKKAENLAEIFSSYHLLADLAQQRGNYIEKNVLEQKADSVQNLIQMDQMAASVAEFNAQYESEKKESQIRIQEATIQHQKIGNYLLIGGIISLTLILFLSYRNYLHRQKLQHQRINELEIEKQLLATESLLKGEEQERGRLAKDLHDGLGGMLSGIKHSMQTMKGNLIMTPDNVQAFERSIDMLDSSIREMRRVAHNLMPESLAKFGLEDALLDFCNEINLTQVIHISYQSLGLKEYPSLEQGIATAVYRIVQELVNNSIKHAQAKEVLIQLTRDKKSLILTAEDDGIGFDPQILQNPKGIGWKNIQSRVDFLKGQIDIQSDLRKGTSILIEIPV